MDDLAGVQASLQKQPALKILQTLSGEFLKGRICRPEGQRCAPRTAVQQAVGQLLDQAGLMKVDRGSLANSGFWLFVTVAKYARWDF